MVASYLLTNFIHDCDLRSVVFHLSQSEVQIIRSYFNVSRIFR